MPRERVCHYADGTTGTMRLGWGGRLAARFLMLLWRLPHTLPSGVTVSAEDGALVFREPDGYPAPRTRSRDSLSPRLHR